MIRVCVSSIGRSFPWGLALCLTHPHDHSAKTQYKCYLSNAGMYEQVFPLCLRVFFSFPSVFPLHSLTQWGGKKSCKQETRSRRESQTPNSPFPSWMPHSIETSPQDPWLIMPTVCTNLPKGHPEGRLASIREAPRGYCLQGFAGPLSSLPPESGTAPGHLLPSTFDVTCFGLCP